MDTFYYLNKLKLNLGKTKVMVTKTQDLKKIQIKSPKGEPIGDDKSIKILGY